MDIPSDVQKLINDNGERWDATADRALCPIRLTTSRTAGTPVYTITLPDGQSHPNWHIEVGELSEEDACSISPLERVGMVLMVVDGKTKNYTQPAYQMNGYILDPARHHSGWVRSIRPVTVTIEETAFASSKLPLPIEEDQ